jgi:hypothetical protein
LANASKRNQQATQVGQQRTSKESNKYLKQVAELQNLTLARHPTVAGRPIIVGHPSVGTQPPMVVQPAVAGHPTLTGHGMSTQWQNIQDSIPRPQPTLQSW